MKNLAATLRSLGKYTEAEKLVIQAQEVKGRVAGAESPYTIATMASVQEAQEAQVLNMRTAFEENLHSI